MLLGRQEKLKNNRALFSGLIICGSAFVALFSLAITALHVLPTVSAESASSLVSLGVKPALSLTLVPDNSLSIPLSPSGSGNYSSRKLTATVSTNNATGYTLAFSAGAGGTSLINSAAVSNNDVPPTSATIAAPNNFATMNTWGFAVPKVQTNSTGLLPNEATNGFGNSYTEVSSVETYAETYATIPQNASPLTLKETALNGTNDKTELFFGARVDLFKPSGTYRGTVVFTAVGNYTPEEPTPVGPCYNGEPDSPCNVVMEANNLIPIKYTGTNTSPQWSTPNQDVPADWYDYGARKWANAVSVTSSTYASYKSASPNTIILEEDILAYYVYVPRFAYEVQRSSPTNYAVCGDGTYSSAVCSDTAPTPYEITFDTDWDQYYPYGVSQNGDGAGICESFSGAYKDCAGSNNKYLSHPAFRFSGDGIWVGKFETSNTSTATTNNNHSSNTGDADTIIKPTVFSRRNQNIASQQLSIDAVNGYLECEIGSCRQYAHLATDDHWGAVTYLSNSIYGRVGSASGSEVWINNCYASNTSSTSPRYVTGISGNSTSEAYTSGPCYSSSSIDNIPVENRYFGTIGVHASTTDNVYGIYDMSGGSEEYTLSNYSDGINNGTIGDSGLTKQGSLDYIDRDSRYYAVYPSYIFSQNNPFSNYQQCLLGSSNHYGCSGRGLFETTSAYSVSSGAQSWNGDSSSFVTSSNPWAKRGGKYDETTAAGVYSMKGATGGASSSTGYRVVLHTGEVIF